VFTAVAVDIACQGKKGRPRRGYLSTCDQKPAAARRYSPARSI
jgi:hypothetical protein